MNDLSMKIFDWKKRKEFYTNELPEGILAGYPIFLSVN